MNQAELEKKLIQKMARTLTEQEKRVLEAIENEEYAALASEGYWAEENREFPWMQTLLAAGAVAGAALVSLPKEANDPSSNAERWAREYSLGLINDLDETSRATVTDALDRFFAGEVDKAGLGDLIEGAFGPDRALRIGATESTRAFAEGQLAAGAEIEALGLTPRYIFHYADDSACEDCAELDGEEVDQGDFPPLHPNCRCVVTVEWDGPEW